MIVPVRRLFAGLLSGSACATVTVTGTLAGRSGPRTVTVMSAYTCSPTLGRVQSSAPPAAFTGGAEHDQPPLSSA